MKEPCERTGNMTRGHTWFTWFKPRGHSDIGADVGVRYTKPGIDEAHGVRR